VNQKSETERFGGYELGPAAPNLNPEGYHNPKAEILQTFREFIPRLFAVSIGRCVYALTPLNRASFYLPYLFVYDCSK
jgi:hypothetical protein